MKFWQLYWLLSDSNALKELVDRERRWQQYRPILEDFNHYVDVQNRKVLDQTVDPELCRAALEVWGHKFWIDENEYLVEFRSERDNVENDRLISAYEGYLRYGADVLVNVLEYGREKVRV